MSGLSIILSKRKPDYHELSDSEENDWKRIIKASIIPNVLS